MKQNVLSKSALIALILSVIMTFNGCSLYINSIDKLMRPPMSDVALEEAIKDEFGSDITMASPEVFSSDDTFEYLSSTYNYCDIDGDGSDEVIAFLTEGVISDDMHMVVLEKLNGKWSIISKVNGIGNSIQSLVVESLSSNTAKKQIITTWKYVDKNVLTIHSLEEDSSGKSVLKPLCENYQYDEYKMCDIDNDGICEFLVLDYSESTVSEKSGPEVYVLKYNANGKVVPISSVELPQNITEVNHIISDSYDAVSSVVYLDALDDAGDYYSYVVYWDNKTSSLVKYSEGSPIVLNEQSFVNLDKYSTKRSAAIKCSDTNSDNIPEIPMSIDFSFIETGGNNLSFTVWSQMAFTEDAVCEFLVYGNDYRIYFDANNYFKLPHWANSDSIFAKYNKDRKTWSVMYSPRDGFSQSDDMEDYLCATVFEIDDSYVERYVESGYTLLGASASTQGNSMVCLLTQYGYSYGFRENDFINIK